MSYRTVKKEYGRKFAPAYVRNTTRTELTIEPEKVVYVKTVSPVNKATTGDLMKKALHDKKPISECAISESSTENIEEASFDRSNVSKTWLKKHILKGFTGPAVMFAGR